MVNPKKKNQNDLLSKIVQWRLNWSLFLLKIFLKNFLYSTETSAHGFKNFFGADRLLKKIFWGCILLSSISYCIYQVVLIITLFFKFNVLTSLKIAYEAPTYYPAVVICNLNAYDGNVAREHMNRILIEKNISLYNYEPVDYVDIAADFFKSTFETEALRGQFDLYYNGFYLNQMLISCR